MSRFGRLALPEALREPLPVTARLTTGEVYSGAQEYAGRGVVRSCIRCGKHRPSAGGRLIKRGALKHWHCAGCVPLKFAEAA